MRVQAHPARPADRVVRTGRLVGGVVLGLLALGQLVPTLLAVVLGDGLPLAARLLDVLLFGGPLVVVLYAALVLVRQGLGLGSRVGRRPAGRPGRWALRSLLAVPVLLAAAGAAALLRHLLAPEAVVVGFWGEPEAAVLVVGAWVAGAAALGLGLVALLRDRDRSVPVLLSLALGWVVTVFGVGEVLVPH